MKYYRCPDQYGTGGSENGAVSKHVFFSNPIQQASWYFWSDGNNWCGSSGAYWEMDKIMIR